MKRTIFLIFIVLCSFVFVVSCDDGDDEGSVSVVDEDAISPILDEEDADADVVETEAEVVEDSDVVETEEEAVEDSDVVVDEEETDADVSESSGAICKEIDADFHAAEYYVVFKDFEAYDSEGDYDLYIIKYDGGPAYFLNAEAEGINLGNEKAFSEITEAPSEGYSPDDSTTEAYVIGSSYRSGGSGTTGFTMSNNVYVIKTAEGNYAKVIFTQAKAGALKMNVCYQPDGSTNISGDVE